MIQRIQSIFLLIAVLAFGSLFYLPFAETQKAYEDFLADSVFTLLDSTVLTIIVILGILATFIAIFVFKNRIFQIRLVWISIVLGILIPNVAGLQFYLQTDEVGLANVNYSMGFGLFIPLIIIIVLLMAKRNIKKDEKLVKSMDRLR